MGTNYCNECNREFDASYCEECRLDLADGDYSYAVDRDDDVADDPLVAAMVTRSFFNGIAVGLLGVLLLAIGYTVGVLAR